MKKIISPENSAKPIGPYSTAVSYKDLIFTSGQIGFDKDGNFAGDDVAEQTRQVIENIKVILSECESSLSNIIKTTVFLKDMNDFAAMNEVYGSYFNAFYPARSTVEVARLPKDVKVEIEVIAYKD